MKTTNNVESEEGLGESGAKRRENGEGGNVDTRGGEEGLEKSGHKERGKGGIGKVATKGIGGLETKAQAGGDKAGRAGADGAKGKGVESVDAVREIKGRIAEALEGAGQGPLAHGTVAADASAVGASGERETEERPDVNREASRAPPSRTLSADSTDDYADASETLDEPIDG